MSLERIIAHDLLSIGAVFLRPDEPFTWASGIKSPIYCDNRLTLTAPAVRTHVEEGLVDLICKHYPNVEVLMGTSTAGIAHAAGLDSVISPKLLTAGQILQVVRGMQNSKGSVMNALYKIADGHAEAMEFVANATTRNRDTPLRELRLKPGILVAVLVHQGRIVIPDGSSSIAAGDTVIVISRNHGILDLNDIFEDSLLELGGDA